GVLTGYSRGTHRLLTGYSPGTHPLLTRLLTRLPLRLPLRARLSSDAGETREDRDAGDSREPGEGDAGGSGERLGPERERREDRAKLVTEPGEGRTAGRGELEVHDALRQPFPERVPPVGQRGEQMGDVVDPVVHDAAAAPGDERCHLPVQRRRVRPELVVGDAAVDADEV